MSLLIMLCLFSTVTLSIQTCSNSNGCECSFADESAFKSKSEILAAAVGALGPLVAVGGGFGIWKLIQSKKSDAGTCSSLSREGSDLSDGSARKSGSASPATNSRRSDSRLRFNTPVSIKDMDLDNDFLQSPTPTDDPRWSPAGRFPPSLTSRMPLSAKSDNLNSWMF